MHELYIYWVRVRNSGDGSIYLLHFAKTITKTTALNPCSTGMYICRSYDRTSVPRKRNYIMTIDFSSRSTMLDTNHVMRIRLNYKFNQLRKQFLPGLRLLIPKRVQWNGGYSRGPSSQMGLSEMEVQILSFL